jgi:hypothetical protein
MTLPPGIRVCLWSWDLSSLDARRDRRLIITQVLNDVRWEDVQWLLKRYQRSDLRQVLQKPGRGVWLPDVLNFWLRRLNVHLAKSRIQAARMNIHPFDSRENA